MNDLPYAVTIFDTKGYMVYGNELFFLYYDVADPEKYFGHYNILNDNFILDVRGAREFVEAAFTGGKHTLKNYKMPVELPYSERKPQLSNKYFITDVYAYSLYCVDGKISYIVMLYQVTNTYSGKYEVMKAQEYINENWKESFNLKEIVKTSGMSYRNLSRVFKRETDLTIYEYYKHLKINKLKEKLCDPSLSVTEAFLSCGLDFTGRYRQFFKDIVGMTPTEYWETHH